MNYYQLMGLERPPGLIGYPAWAEDMTYSLPGQAQDERMIMLDISYRQPAYGSRDPVIIFNRDGNILHIWPDGYVPGYYEITKVCRNLLER